MYCGLWLEAIKSYTSNCDFKMKLQFTSKNKLAMVIEPFLKDNLKFTANHEILFLKILRHMVKMAGL